MVDGTRIELRSRCCGMRNKIKETCCNGRVQKYIPTKPENMTRYDGGSLHSPGKGNGIYGVIHDISYHLSHM